MKRLWIILAFSLFLPCLGFAQHSLKHIHGLSNIASRGSYSEREIVSGLFNHNDGIGLLNLLGYSNFIDDSYHYGFYSLLDDDYGNLKNTAIVEQNGTNNSAQVNQTGNANIALIEQAGNNIQNTVNQTGTGNIYGSSLEGNNHKLEVSQVGNNNLYLLNYESSKTLTHTVQQIGNNLKAVQIGVGKPYEIKEFGTGMNIIVRHYHW